MLIAGEEVIFKGRKENHLFFELKLTPNIQLMLDATKIPMKEGKALGCYLRVELISQIDIRQLQNILYPSGKLLNNSKGSINKNTTIFKNNKVYNKSFLDRIKVIDDLFDDCLVVAR